MHPDDTHCPGCESGDCPGLAASQPPSGDAPDLREATHEAVAILANRDGWDDANAMRDRVLAILRAALAASAPSSPATPAPLEVERLIHRLKSPPYNWNSDIVDDLRRVAYANQEGGEPRKENTDD